METAQPTTEVLNAGGFALPVWLVAALRLYITVVMPLVLVLINARLLMSNGWVRWEYNRPNFPEDSFGFTLQDRLILGPLALEYLFNAEDIDFLGDQTFEDGSPLYQEGELSHMHDVKVFTGTVVRVGIVLVSLLLLSSAALAWQADTRPDLQQGLFRGSIVTLLLLVVLVAFAVISFEAFFTQFHQLFFQPGTWRFHFSDTLIRLFPEKLWFDAFATLLIGAVVEAIIIGGLAWWWGKQLAG